MLQNGFRLVIGGVSYRHGGGAEFVSHLGHEDVAHLPGQLLKRRDRPVFPVLGGVLFYYRKRQVEFVRQIFGETSVFIGLIATEIVVQMGDVES